jgi:hypothetical protein
MVMATVEVEARKRPQRNSRRASMGRNLSKEGLEKSLAAETDQASRQMFQIAQRTKQKIAACGSSYREMHSKVGAAVLWSNFFRP